MKIHIILNSHLDPCWGWGRSQGTDEVIATARTACDLLDRYHEIRMTRGEAWFYETVEKCDPATFKRIRRHVDSGRWCIVGGFYVQPDCNLPSPETMLRHGEIAQAYFRKKFGRTAQTGYNVDSFGHMATLPDFYNAAGMKNYVMMRPEFGIKDLPGNPFLWLSEKGASLRTFRIARAYCTTGNDIISGLKANLEETIRYTPANMKDTMCFVGVGNHGGGPVPEEIEYLLAHPDLLPGHELVFSTPDLYFDAIKKVRLPEYKGELQYHAIGCYSAVSRIKREVRSSEDLLLKLERFSKREKALFTGCDDLKGKWKKILFATFHDILPGTCIRSAYPPIYDDLGKVRSFAREKIELAIRKKNLLIPADKAQRLVFDNLSSADHNGIIECEPWFGYAWGNDKLNSSVFEFRDETGKRIPSQRIPQEAAMPMIRYALDLSVPAGKRKIVSASVVSKEKKYKLLPEIKEDFHGVTYRTAAYPDTTDTWSHSIPGYTFRKERVFKRVSSVELSSGEVLRDRLDEFTEKHGSLKLRTREFRRRDIRDLFLRLVWAGEREQIRLEFKLPFTPVLRRDQIPGGLLERPMDGNEYPVRDYTVLSDASGRSFVLMGDFTSLCVRKDGIISVMLLRSSVYLHHDPYQLPEHHLHPVADQGNHDFFFRLLFQEKFDPGKVAQELVTLRQELFFSEVTLGCRLFE